MQITVALLQMNACSTLSEAVAKGEAYCREARERGAELALFPECWSSGYFSYSHFSRDIWQDPAYWNEEDPNEPPEEKKYRQWLSLSVTRDSAYVRHFQALARELEMAIAITYLEKLPYRPDHPRNTVSLIDRTGEIVLTYAKIHTCDFDPTEYNCTPGHELPVCTLRTTQGELQVGAMICYDREFPETARLLMLKGAELILIPNACELERHRLAQLDARAFENMVGLAIANYSQPLANGHSVAFDGMAFDVYGSRDMLLVEADEQEGINLAIFDLEALRTYRRRETMGQAFRRPHLYELLISDEIKEPFVRVNEAGERYDPRKRIPKQ